MLDSDPASVGHDLTACDREPIHIPGSIQPHGMLLIADGETGIVKAGAGDIEARLSPDWLGQSLEGLLGQEIASRVTRPSGREGVVLKPVSGRSERFDAVLHRTGDLLLVELEPAEAEALESSEVVAYLDAAGHAFDRASNMRDLCREAADLFHEMTGFDRVMVYQFLDDDAGVVVAEACAKDVGSFMNHHFPASDIPKQARALYLRNRIRVIPDVTYAAAPIRGGSDDWSKVDLSDVSLRSVSPIHLQYLRNMDVGASASISIVQDGTLWGLIACHHRTKRNLTLPVRLACRTLAGGLSRQIRSKDEAEFYRQRIRLRSAEDTIVAKLGGDGTLEAFFAKSGAELCAMLGADGFAAVQGRDIFEHGSCPPREDMREIATWLRDRAFGQPFATDKLSAHLPSAARYMDVGSGLLGVIMSTEVPTILMWFRAEKLQVIEWAGNPHKNLSADPLAILTPRTSFEAYSETVRGHATAWTLAEVESAGRVVRLLLEERQNRRLKELNEELGATVRENENLIKQKDYLLREVNHRVQNSLQLVSAFLRLQARTAGDERVTSNLNEAQRRLTAVALVHRRLYGGDSVEVIDLGRYIEDLMAEMMATMDDAWRDQITLNLAPIRISADRAVNVGLILTELVINANKYAYGGDVGPLTIMLEQHRNRFRLIVADRGQGKGGGSHQGSGFGSRMLSALVDRLSGSIEESDNRPGLRVIMMAPIE